MSNCQLLSEMIVELGVGDLPAAQSVELRAHAEVCEPCGVMLAREIRLVEALSNLPPVPSLVVPEPVLESSALVSPESDMAPIHELHPAGRRWANARLAAAVALVSAAGLLLAVQLGGGLDSLGHTADVSDASVHGTSATSSTSGTSGLAVPLEIRTVVASDDAVPPVDDYFLALTAGVEAVVMRRPAQDRCANGLCASGR
jgi:hypothetical protein